MHHLFAHKDVHRSKRHGIIVERYLSGRNNFSIGGILHHWLTSPDGAGHNDDPFMYSLTTPYTDQSHVRTTLTSFAAQLVEKQIVRDVRAAVLKSGGLHAPAAGKPGAATETEAGSEGNTSSIQLADLGSSLMPNMKRVFREKQGLLYDLMLAVASPDLSSPRKYRPPELAVLNAISMLTFTRNYYARLLPLSRGILYLASHVPRDIIDINSRVGTMPSIETIKSALRGLSNQKAIKIRKMGRDVGLVEVDGRQMVKANVIIFDNTQHFRRQRERRIGWENLMIIGIGATFFQRLVAPTALNPADRRRRLALNLRRILTVDDILTRIDFRHLREVGILQFISALSTYVPDASIYKAEIQLRYNTRCKKRQLPLAKDDLNPLAHSGKNEAYIPELKDALIDFLRQLGQKEDDYDPRLWFLGGDGMSFHNSHLVKKYMQNHVESSFQSFELMIPVLQVWHTLWANLCRLFVAHWGEPLNENPSTLGNSAKKIGRPAPGNLKKVDYYPAAELLALVHDMRMLDCWRAHYNCQDIQAHFRTLADSNQLPSFEELEVIARQLYDTYASTVAHYEARIDARDGKSAWSANIPLGTPWTEPSVNPTSLPTPAKKSRKRKSTKASSSTATSPPASLPPFHGDNVVSDSAYFMRDASIAREAAAAVAVCDVGRLYETLKVMLVNFAGSTHSRYMGYLLEMVSHIELESSPELANATLDTLVINPSGLPGGGQAGDIFQKRMNREMEPIVQRKDTDYGSNHVRNLWSRNIKDIYDLKAEMRAGVGLAKRSGRHKEPHQKPEVRILLSHYRDTQLSLRRPGRTFGEAHMGDTFAAGVKKLGEGALTQWARKTVRDRGLHWKNESNAEMADESSSDEEDDSDDEIPLMSLGLIHAFDGDVVVDLDSDMYADEENDD
ncbi:hypothetical protein C8R45DRAFT_816656 [Mycena sanguinolenta]|nr:hypothetical protein C8R45DRAFT_816656 [Mycena sanguinolenta]